ncbi:MAG: DUF2255 family protein [Brooklawnia sp.]
MWSVVTGGDLHVRPYNGKGSRWYQSALAQGGGRIRIAGTEYEVEFAPADPTVFQAVDEAYRAKYAGSPYLAPMIAEGPRSASVRVMPRRD